MNEAIRSGIVDLLDDVEMISEDLLAATSLKPEEGVRFIELLLNVGLLEQKDGKFGLSPFSRSFLSKKSHTSQRHVIEFEPILMDNWRQIGNVLSEGQGCLIREQSPDNYKKRLQLYQAAMSEAATVRSYELWDRVTKLPEQGTIIDIGAGNGVYLREFLARQPRWEGIGCDLFDVCSQISPQSIPGNLRFHQCNILDQQEMNELVKEYCGKADLLLFSNICHCYSPEENIIILQKAGELVKEGGLIVIHDFFRDANDFGATYDLHMMLNSYNGRSYSFYEITDMLKKSGFMNISKIQLPSLSSAILGRR